MALCSAFLCVQKASTVDLLDLSIVVMGFLVRVEEALSFAHGECGRGRAGREKGKEISQLRRIALAQYNVIPSPIKIASRP